MASTILLVFAFVFFVLAGLNVPSLPRANWLGLGAAFVTAALLVGALLR